MEVTCGAGADVVRKRARNEAEQRQLSQEAAVLRVVAHPGVTQLVGVEGAEPPEGLLLRRVAGGDLAGLGAQPVEVVAGLGAALATTVADLHEIGVTHGAIDASHVLLDTQGRPVLCSWGRSEPAVATAPAEMHRREDVRALARLLLERLPAGAPPRVTRTLRAAAGPGRQRRCRDARWLARQLVACVAGARLPAAGGTAETGEPVGHGRPRRPRRWTPVSVGAATGLCVVAVTAAWLVTGSSSSRPSVAPPPGVPCPPADDGCGPVPTPGGLLTVGLGRYQIAARGDVTVLGRWRCGSTALPAVLRPASGRVWMFDAWPTAGHPVPGRLAAQLSAAWTLRVVPQPSGCDRLRVERRDLPAFTIDPGRP